MLGSHQDKNENSQILSAACDYWVEPFCLLSQSNEVIFFNKALEQVLGAPLEEVRGQSLFSAMSRLKGLEVSPWEELFHLALSQGRSFGPSRSEDFPPWMDVQSFESGGQKFLQVLFRDPLDEGPARAFLDEYRQIYQIFVEHTPDFIVKVDLNGKILFVNRYFPGVKPEQVLGREVYSFLPEMGQSQMRDSLEEVAKTREMVTFEITGPGPNNSSAFYRNRISPIIEFGKLTSFLLTSTDITSEKILSRKLSISQEWLHMMAKVSEMAAWDWNLKTGKVTFDERWKNLYGYEMDEMPMSLDDWAPLAHPEDREISIALAKDHLSGKTDNYETRIRIKHANGHWVPVLSKGRVVERDSQGNPTRFSGIHLDLSRQTEMEEANRLRERQALVQSKMATLGHLAAGIAHEINNPLAIIDGLARSMRRAINEGQTDILDSKLNSLEKAVTRAKTIVGGLRRYSYSKPEDQPVEMNLNSIVKESAEVFQEILRGRDIQLNLDLMSRSKVLCRPSDLVQVFVNLINNSLFAVSKMAERWICLRSWDEEGRVKVAVVDSGSGIPQEVVSKMFAPFYTTKPRGEGTGLGLEITRNILGQHEGEIEYDDQSRNTCFVVTLKTLGTT